MCTLRKFHRKQKWLHPRWRPKAEVPPSCAAAAMGGLKSPILLAKLQHTASQNNKGKLFNTSDPSRCICVILLESCKFAIHLLKAMEHRFTNCFKDLHVRRKVLLHLRRCSDCDTIALLDVRQYRDSCYRHITTDSGELTQKGCNSSALFLRLSQS